MQRQANLVYPEWLKLSSKHDADKRHEPRLKGVLRGPRQEKHSAGWRALLPTYPSSPATWTAPGSWAAGPGRGAQNSQHARVPTAVWLEEESRRVSLFPQYSLVCPSDSCLRATVKRELDWAVTSGEVGTCQQTEEQGAYPLWAQFAHWEKVRMIA